MKILYFHQHFTTPDGPGGSRSYEFARRLVRAGHQVTLVCGSHDMAQTGLTGSFVKNVRRGEVEGFRIVEYRTRYSNHMSLAARSRAFLSFSWYCVRFALKEKADLVFATTTPLTMGLPGIAARWIRGIPFVFEVRDLWPELPKAMGVIRNPLILAALSLLEWTSYHAADACIGLSPGIVEGIQRRGGRNVTLIPNCADLDLFTPQIGKPSGDFVAIFAGAHGLANGLDAVLDTAGVVKRRGRNDIQFLFIGDGRLKPALMEKAQREGLENCVFRDPMPKRELARITAAAGAGLMILKNIPAFYQGTSPNKFFDYLASGIPVVNNYPGWVAELISQNGCGMVVPPDQPEAFADALIWLADHREEAARMGANARRLAETEFARDVMADRFLRVLEAV